MEILTVWCRYEGDEWDEAPQLAEAWTEYDIDNNPDGWRDAVDKAIGTAGVRDHRLVAIHVSYDEIVDGFRVRNVQGVVKEDGA